MADLGAIGVVRDAGHSVMEIAVGVEAVDRAYGVVRAYVKRRALREPDVVDWLLRRDRAFTLMPVPVVFERLDCFRRVQVSLEGDAVGTNSHIGRAALLTGRATHNAVLVVTLVRALAPAQPPRVGNAVAGH